MRDGPCPASDRGQSELVGFLLVFSVVVLTIALVGLTGFVGLDGAKDYQRTTNAEQAFTGLAANVDDVARTGAPSRSTQVRIADGRLSLEPMETRIEVVGGGNTTNANVSTHPIVYDSGTGTTVTYRSGALVRRDGDSAVMFREPDFVLTNDSVILPLVRTSQASGGPVGGTGDVEVRTARTDDTHVVRDGPVEQITLNLSTQNPGAWARYFEGASGDGLNTTVQRDEEYVAVTLEPDRATVTVHRVDVTFQ